LSVPLNAGSPYRDGAGPLGDDDGVGHAVEAVHEYGRWRPARPWRSRRRRRPAPGGADHQRRAQALLGRDRIDFVGRHPVGEDGVETPSAHTYTYRRAERSRFCQAS
jgi:hypothetical protein